MFLAGMAAFTVTSLACGLAPTTWTLVAARVLQGASAAAMVPQVLATIQATAVGPRRVRALGLYGATAGMSGCSVSSPVAGWSPPTCSRARLAADLPAERAGRHRRVAAALRLVPDSRAHRPGAIDVPGTLLLGGP